MATTLLKIAGDGQGWELELPHDKPLRIGRSPECEVCLPGGPEMGVSREHAVLQRDPLGRWIVQDLDSRNGVWVGHTRVKVQSLAPGAIVNIGRYSLTLEPAGMAAALAPDSAEGGMTMSVDPDGDEGLVYAGEEQLLSADHVRRLNALGDHLTRANDLPELYTVLCDHLTEFTQGSAVVVRVPPKGQSFPQPLTPIAAAHGPQGQPHRERVESGFRLSRRVLDAVRTTGVATMAGGRTGPQQPQSLDLTQSDEAPQPRAVLCAPISDGGEERDVVYLDVPAAFALERMLDYLQAAARQTDFSRKALLLGEERAHRRVVEHQIELARRIQANITPTDALRVPGVEIAAHWNPLMWVSGDFCDYWALPDGRIALALADVCGHGLPAAMVMMNLQAALRTVLRFCTDLPTAVGYLNEYMAPHMEESMYAELFLAVFDPRSGALDFVNATHLCPTLVGPDGSAVKLTETGNPPVGMVECDYTSEQGVVAPGGALVICTDGVCEAQNPSGEQFGEDRLRAALSGAPSQDAPTLVHRVTTAVDAFCHPLPQQDDLTVLALVYRTPEA